MSTPTLTVGQVAGVLDGLRAKKGGQARAVGRGLVRHLRRHFPGRSFSPPTSESIRLFEETAAPFEELDRVEDENRQLARKLETIRAETARLRRSRCERTVDGAIRRGVVWRDAREATIRQLEEGDVNLRSAIDPLYVPPMPSEEDFARQFEDRFGEKPVVSGPPQTEAEAERRQLAATLGIREEDVI